VPQWLEEPMAHLRLLAVCEDAGRERQSIPQHLLDGT